MGSRLAMSDQFSYILRPGSPAGEAKFSLRLYNYYKYKNRDGRVKKYINKICRDNHIHYTSLRLLFSIIMHLTCSLSTLDLRVEDITVFAPLKKQVQGCIVDVIIPTNLVLYVLYDPAIPTLTFNFIQLSWFLYLFLFFFYCSQYNYGLLSIFQCRKWEVLKIIWHAKFVATPLVNLRSYASRLTKKAALGGQNSNETLPFKEKTKF